MSSASHAVKVWLTRLLLFALVASFALWGISDVFQPGASGNYVAKVGDRTISRSDYLYALDNARNNLQQMMGENFNPDMLKSLNVEQQVLTNLVNDTALDLEAERFGIRISDAEIMDEIRHTPAFLNDKGAFDKTVFAETLKRAGLTEAMFVGQIKKDKARKLLSETLMQLDLYPSVLPGLLHKAALEKRHLNIWEFQPSRFASSPAQQPTPEQLKTYYDAHQTKYVAPEMRTFDVVKIDHEAFSKNAQISEKDLRAIYESQRESYALPEKRDVQQLLYNDEISAKNAAEMASKGQSFASVAQKIKPLNTDIELGFIARSEALEDAADAIFNAQENSVTAPIQSPLGWHVFYVKTIDHSRQATFEDVREQLAKEQQQAQAEEQLYKHIETLENATMSGTSLAQVAKDHGETLQTIGPVSLAGMMADGTPLTAQLPIEQWLSQGFTLPAGQVSSAMRGSDGHYYMISVRKIDTPRTKSLDEVRGLVEHDWQVAALKEKLQAALTSKIESTKDFDALLNGLGGQSSTRITTQKNSELSSELLSDAFNQPVGGHTGIHALPNGALAVATVHQIHPASDDELQAQPMEQESELRMAYSNDVYELFMAQLNKNYQVSVNQVATKSEPSK